MKNNNYISLSHWINETTPTYGDQGGFTRTSFSSIKEGRTSNSEKWQLNNHLGTHIDFPRHFDNKGLSSSDYNNPFFIYDQVGIIVLEKAVLPNHIITVEDIIDKVKLVPKSTEILLLKTNFEQYRGQDIYWEQNPGYEESLAFLFREHFTNLRAFGFDSISLSSLNDRSMGKKAHQAFLKHNEPILIIEDMSLTKVTEKTDAQKLFVILFPISNTDGTPVNCFLSLNK